MAIAAGLLSSLRNAPLKLTSSRMEVPATVDSNLLELSVLLLPVSKFIGSIPHWRIQLRNANYERARMTTRVVGGYHLKSPSGMEHEKLVFEFDCILNDGGNPVRSYLTTERGAEIDGTNPSSSSSSVNLPVDCTTMVAVLQEHTAMDRVIVAGTCESTTLQQFIDQHIVVRQFEIRDIMTIEHLAILLDAIHGTAPKYKASENNCYWYAWTISEVIKERFYFSTEDAKNIHKKGSYGFINLGKTDTVAQAITAYNTLWNSEQSQAEVRFLLFALSSLRS